MPLAETSPENSSSIRTRFQICFYRSGRGEIAGIAAINRIRMKNRRTDELNNVEVGYFGISRLPGHFGLKVRNEVCLPKASVLGVRSFPSIYKIVTLLPVIQHPNPVSLPHAIIRTQIRPFHNAGIRDDEYADVDDALLLLLPYGRRNVRLPGLTRFPASCYIAPIAISGRLTLPSAGFFLFTGPVSVSVPVSMPIPMSISFTTSTA
jgi:hypothetical protein